jgi:hypothetical protein
VKRLFMYSVIGLLGLSWFGGCSEESSKGTKSETTIKTPSGTTTITTEQKVDKSGDTPKSP